MTYFRKLKYPIDEKPSFWRWHHFFVGGWIALAGFFVLYLQWYAISAVVVALGSWVRWDDWLQHRKQMKEWESTGEYVTVSFWHWIIEQFRGEEYDS